MTESFAAIEPEVTCKRCQVRLARGERAEPCSPETAELLDSMYETRNERRPDRWEERDAPDASSPPHVGERAARSLLRFR